MLNKKIKKTIIHVGYIAKVLLEGKSGKHWHSVGRFDTRPLALAYIKRRYPSATKIHIEGVRIDATPIYFAPKKKEASNDQG